MCAAIILLRRRIRIVIISIRFYSTFIEEWFWLTWKGNPYGFKVSLQNLIWQTKSCIESLEPENSIYYHLDVTCIANFRLCEKIKQILEFPALISCMWWTLIISQHFYHLKIWLVHVLPRKFKANMCGKSKLNALKYTCIHITTFGYNLIFVITLKWITHKFCRN